MADNTLIVQIDLEKGDVSSAFTAINTNAKKAGKKSGGLFGSGFTDVLKGSLSSLVGNIGADLARDALRGFSSAIKGTINEAIKLEVISAQFETILKSTEAADKQIRDLQDFAATTPFQLEGLSVATRQLLSFGTSSEDVIPVLKKLGDLAAGTGARIDELTIPFGRLVSTQKLTLVELDKFADRGINLFGQLSKQTGISLKTIRDDISKGKIPFEEFTEAINTLTSEGGLFFGATERQSKTLSGVLSTLGDNVTNLQANLGQLFTPFIKAAAERITEAVQAFNKELTTSFNLVDDIIQPLSSFGTAISTFVLAPLELVINIFKVVQGAVNVGVAAMVAAFGKIGGAAGELLSFFSPNSEIAKGLITFSESSKEVLADTTQSIGDSVDGIFDFPITSKFEEMNEKFVAGFTKLSETTKTSAVSIATDSKEAVEQISVDATNNLFGIWEGLRVQIRTTTEALKKQGVQTAAIIKGGLVKGIAGGIQNVTESLIKGENAFQNFGKFILSTFGDLAIQLGTFFIAQGIAIEALNAVSGTGAIAAGAALVALGSILKSFSGGSGSSSASSSSSGGGQAGSFSNEPSTLQDSGFEDEADFEERTNVNLVVQGPVFNTEETARSLVDLFNDNFDKTGAVLTGARLA